MKRPTVLDRLRAFHREGLTDTQIAGRLGYSIPHVGRLRKRLNLPKQDMKGKRTFDVGEAAALHAQGYNDRMIAERLDVSRETIQKWRKRERLRGNGWTRYRG